jgi:hypothetical protein
MVLSASAMLTMGVLSPAAAGAAAEQHAGVASAEAAGDATILSSPKCSSTESWGKIKYQACMRYNCDANSCFLHAYGGLINTATGPRTVNWELRIGDNGRPTSLDDDGTVTIAAGAQRTIESENTHTTACDFTATVELYVQYDSAGRSPAASVSEFLACR